MRPGVTFKSEYLTVCSVCFQDLLTRHKLLSAEFLEQYYDRVSLKIANEFKETEKKNCKSLLHISEGFHCWNARRMWQSLLGIYCPPWNDGKLVEKNIVAL